MKKSTEEKKDREYSLPKLIFNIIFWGVISVLAVVWLTEFFLIRNDKEPIFCLSTKTHEFEDGTVEECTGLGYKVYDYKRESLTATEFGPFFIKMED